MFGGIISCGPTNGSLCVTLKPPSLANWPFGMTLMNDTARNAMMMLGDRQPYVEASYLAFLNRVEQDPSRYVWWVYVNGQFAGIIGIWLIREYTLEKITEVSEGAEANIVYLPDGLPGKGCYLYYIVDEKYGGKGVASTAIKAVLRYAFEQLKHNFMLIEILTVNAISLHLAEKFGFRRYMTVYGGHSERGKTYNVWCGILTNEEYKLRQDSILPRQ